MEYTLQLSDEIALQKDDLATYEGAAFTGEEYYLTVPLEHSIHIYGADFTFFTSCTCPHAYAAICYDSINYCFWVSDAQQHNVVYCLDSDLNELQCFYVQMNLTGDIQQIAYQEERDTLLLSYTDGIAEITKNGEFLHKCPLPLPACHTALPFADAFALIRISQNMSFFDIVSSQGDMLESYDLPVEGVIKDMLWDHDKMATGSSLCFLLLLQKPDGCCFCRCILKPCTCKQPCCCEMDCKTDCICKLLSSIACMEAALSHILNAEGEKLQRAIALSDSICELLEVNRSIIQTITNVTMLEQVLYAKLTAIQERQNDVSCE